MAVSIPGYQIYVTSALKGNTRYKSSLSEQKARKPQALMYANVALTRGSRYTLTPNAIHRELSLTKRRQTIAIPPFIIQIPSPCSHLPLSIIHTPCLKNLSLVHYNSNPPSPPYSPTSTAHSLALQPRPSSD